MKLLQPLPKPRHLAAAIARLIIVAQAGEMRRRGQPNAAIVAATHVSVPSLWKWRRQFLIHGFGGLLPAYPRCGRKPKTQNPETQTA